MLMTHLYYGDPNREFSDRLAETLLTSGADILEIGIPYTDPVCDGEVFQRSCQRALEGGITPLRVIEGIREIREKGYKKPIYLTSYYGPIYKMGVAKFVKKAKTCGVTGLIVPDLLLEEQEELRKVCSRNDLLLIQFATIYSDAARLKKICRASTNFIYCISLPGVTGDNSIGFSTSEESSSATSEVSLRHTIKELKSLTNKKIFVGFGIRSADIVKNILHMGADGVIVGSAIAQIYEKKIGNPETTLPQIEAFIKSLKDSTI